MKKLTLGLALIIFGNVMPTLASANDCGCNVSMPCYRGGFLFEVDGFISKINLLQ